MKGEWRGMNSFLSKTDVRKLLLIHTIEESFQQKVSISDLKEKMGVSEFILLNTYEELKQDILKYQLDEQLQIQKLNQVVQLKKNSSFSTDTLKNLYVKESLGFQIIQDVFEDMFTNSNDYADLFYTSRTKVYSKVNQLKAKLEKLGIKLSSRFKLVGDEIAIRTYINNLYTSVYGMNDYPFSTTLKEQSMRFIKLIETKMDIYMTQTSTTKLLYFISICRIRIENEQFVKNAPATITGLESDSFEDILKETYQEVFNEKVSHNEIDLLVLFIESLDEFPLELENQELDSLTNFFITEFQKQFGNLDETFFKEELINELVKIHYPVLNFNCLQTELDVPVRARFIEENYPEVLEFCRHFIQKASKSKKFYLINQKDVYLSNHYIFLLINVLPPSFFSYPVKVCIDFSLGKNYNQFIYRNIQTFDFINIEISHQLTEDIDILLCDYPISGLHQDTKVIVWSAPPTAGDWAKFGRCIATAKGKKPLKKGGIPLELF